MRFLLHLAFVVAVVAAPSAAWFEPRDQVVMGDSTGREQKNAIDEYLGDEEDDDLGSFELWGGEHDGEEWEIEGNVSEELLWGGDGEAEDEDYDEFEGMGWHLRPNFEIPRPPPQFSNPDHPGDPQRPGRPRRPGRPERPGRPGRPERPGPPGHDHQPHHPPPHHGRLPHHPPPPHKRPGHPSPPWHPHHPIYTNKSLYEIISTSKYTTKIYEIIKNDTELVELLEKSDQNITFFVPTDKAFDGLPPHYGAYYSSIPWKDIIKKGLLYHISPDPYTTRKLFFQKTIPSALKIDDEPMRLRISAGLFTGFKIKINFMSTIIASDILATNGIIHALDHFIIHPLQASILLGVLPTQYSTTAFALLKTGLELPDGPKTIFAPSNRAWARLGYKINGFLFSKFGEKYLTALLKYHIAPGKAVFSDYVAEGKKEEKTEDDDDGYHAELDTLLGDKKVKVDIFRKGPHVRWKLNERVPVFVPDIIAVDAAIQSPARVLIPAHSGKKPNEKEKSDEPFHVLDEDYVSGQEDFGFEEGELTVEQLQEILEPYM